MKEIILKQMSRYLNYAIYFDLIFAIIIGSSIYFGHSFLSKYLNQPNNELIEKIEATIISIGATLIGFLLTITTVIVTFKNGFNEKENTKDVDEIDYSKTPTTSVFDKKISKANQFYNSPIYQQVIKVFVNATYEVCFIIFILLAIQFNIFSIPILITNIVVFMSFILVILCTLRCINIFRLFLNVHV